MKVIGAALALALLPLPALAQATADPRCSTPSALTSVAGFVECARAATEKYRDRSAAIADGYRRIGRDFPAMGEHWIRIGLVFDGTFDPARPEVLTYLLVDGRPQLLGVAYAMPLLAGERPPEGPAGRHAWHDHTRTIEDETLLPRHHLHGGANDGSRLAMMHAWIWSPNPDGMFAADNWAVPLLRLGLMPPDGVTSAVGKALSLVAGGRDYVEKAIAAAASPADDLLHVKGLLDRSQAAVAGIAAGMTGSLLTESQCAELTALWTNLWRELETVLTPASRRRLGHLSSSR